MEASLLFGNRTIPLMGNEPLTGQPWKDLINLAQNRYVPYYLVALRKRKGLNDNDEYDEPVDALHYFQSVVVDKSVHVFAIECFDFSQKETLTKVEKYRFKEFNLTKLSLGKQMQGYYFTGLNYSIEKDANNVCGKCQFIAASIFLYGVSGVKKNNEEGVKWLRCAATNGIVEAYVPLAIYYIQLAASVRGEDSQKFKDISYQLLLKAQNAESKESAKLLEKYSSFFYE